MKLGLISDLHLDFRWGLQRKAETWNILAEKINSAKCDVIVNAGDIHPDPEVRDYFRSLIRVDYFEVLGNHDYYGGKYLAPSRFSFRKDNLKIVGVTLWTDFKSQDPLVMYNFPRIMADGSQIRSPSGIRPIAHDIYNLHKEDLNFIKAEAPDVVVTHHAPSFQSVGERVRESGDSNYYFMSNLEEFILDSQIKLWAHGHMHNGSDYTIGSCRVVANPLGYPGERLSSVDKYEVEILDV